jgi:hypothetical protein
MTSHDQKFQETNEAVHLSKGDLRWQRAGGIPPAVARPAPDADVLGRSASGSCEQSVTLQGRPD